MTRSLWSAGTDGFVCDSLSGGLGGPVILGITSNVFPVDVTTSNVRRDVKKFTVSPMYPQMC